MAGAPRPWLPVTTPAAGQASKGGACGMERGVWWCFASRLTSCPKTRALVRGPSVRQDERCDAARPCANAAIRVRQVRVSVRAVCRRSRHRPRARWLVGAGATWRCLWSGVRPRGRSRAVQCVHLPVSLRGRDPHWGRSRLWRPGVMWPPKKVQIRRRTTPDAAKATDGRSTALET